MTTVIVLSIAFVIMILLPVTTAWIYYLTTKGEILKIKQDMVKDPRYFSHSFTGMIERALPNIEGNNIKLSRQEHFLRPGDLEKLAAEDSKGEVNEMVLAVNEPMIFPEAFKDFSKEIYATQRVTVDRPGITLRAIYSGDRMILGNKTNIVRWADAADTLAIYDDCSLGMSASAGHVVTVGKNVKFRRIYAPVVYFGQYPSKLIDPMEGRDEQTFLLPVIASKRKAKHVTHENMTDEGTAPFSIVSTRTMVVEGAILQGDIHTDGCVRICERAGVLGNIFAEKGILIEKGAFVVGNVFSQGKIQIGPGVMIGRKGRVVSVIARDKLTIAEDVVVYGYISSETLGQCCPLYSSETARYSEKYEFAPYEEEQLSVRFNSLRDYIRTDDMAYRMNQGVLSVRIPEGATSIRRSMFFGCRNLESIRFTNTIKEIMDYAFMDCTGLKSLSTFENTSLEQVGVSAMENCKNIETLRFPKCIKRLKEACFAGMTELMEVSFPKDCELKEIGEHAFRDCVNLESFVVPDGVEKIGVSAFRGCSGLKNISVSERLKDQPGISELKEILPDLKVEYRIDAKDQEQQ